MGLVVVLFGGLNFFGKFQLISFMITNVENTFSYSLLLQTLNSYFERKSISFNPKYMITDGARAIETAISTTLPSSEHLQCWVHMARNVFKRIPTQNRELRNSFSSDFNYLQRAFNKILFIKAADKLINKYAEHSSFVSFLNFFKENYIESHSKWYQGCSWNTCHSTNAIEGFNLALKRNYLCYTKRYTTSLILDVGEILSKKSESYEMDIIENPLEVFYSDMDTNNYSVKLLGNNETKMYYWLHSDNSLCEEEVESKTNYLAGIIIGTQPVSCYRDYRELLNERIVIHDASMPGVWQSMCCNCFEYRRKRKCAHVFFIGKVYLRLNELEYSLCKQDNRGRTRRIQQGASLTRE
eukprot:GAHX01002500.1.p1 GENE.GAHX01002500.1~~GAHX01002500.1.p1  ORF type:complete len:392 (+),score=29.70 GAHX01002500.1:115-1176(+)